ncbi:MAG: C39 family peptidase [Planctomycetes bacterium]|nr:C39 family peptidase [Planctomycetota bacterium]
MSVALSQLQQVRDLYQSGQYLKAYDASKELGPLQDWQGTEARLLAGRLAMNLGSPRLGGVLLRAAWRDEPRNIETCYYHLLSAVSRRGPWAMWKFSVEAGDFADATPALRADWFALRARICGLARDFQSAETWIDRAEALAPERAWIWVERSHLLEMQDRRDEALETAQRSLELRPWYRPSVQAVAHQLVQAGRDDEALALLSEAIGRLEAGDLVGHLATLQNELEMYDESRANYESLPQFFPLMQHEKDRTKWLASMRADAAYYCGDFDEAIRHAREVGEDFQTSFADRMERRDELPGRRRLAVEFVRQNHVTCAPATISALARFWGRQTDHLQVAEHICYDGTPAYRERQWAEENGFATREFRVTLDSAVALIDRGIPFTLTTVDVGSAHLQAVIGYDAIRGTLLIRDPTVRFTSEFLTEKMLEHYASCGPRGMAMIPKYQVHLWDDLELPDTEMFDHLHRLDVALEKHHREDAQDIYEQMINADSSHRLTLRARANLAGYDADTGGSLGAIEAMLEKYPDDGNFLMSKLNCLEELGRREDRLSVLKELYDKPGDPLFWIRYGQELLADAREQPQARYVLERAIRHRPYDGRGYASLADLLWDVDQRSDATQLYRIAACLDDKDERRSRSYFAASRYLHKTDEAIDFLRDRFSRFASKSAWPARTLCDAYETLEQTPAAIATIDSALTLRREDPDLLLFAADFFGRYNLLDRADKLLADAKEVSHRVAWLRTAAHLASYRGDHPAALDTWKQVLAAEPLARDAHDAVASISAMLDGPQAAIAHLRSAVENNPKSYSLRVALIEWLRNDDSPETGEAALRDLIEQHPSDAWARRELAITLCHLKQYEAAQEQADVAFALEPSSPIAGWILARIAEAQGNTEDAKQHCREAIHLSVDYDPAFSALITLCDSKAERVEALQFVQEELKQQVTFGDGLLLFREYALTTYDDTELLAVLRDAREARPDLWHAWDALVKHLSDMQQFDEAHSLATEAVERFPLLPRLWLELAMVCRAKQDREGEVAALTRALEINSTWSDARRQLSEAYEALGEQAKAREILELAIEHDPREVRNRGFLALLLWKLDDRDGALDQLREAARMEPGYEFAWGQLRTWSDELSDPTIVTELARELSRERPDEARSWLILADVLTRPEDRAEAFEAIDRAIALNPRNVDAYTTKAYYLTEEGRYDEAIAICRPEIFGDAIPVALRARIAGIEAERGNIDQAITLMREVVEVDADYYWAWNRLAAWYEATEQLDAWIEAAEQQARVAPRDPAAWGTLGDALQQKPERDRAKQCFQRSIDALDDYAYGALSLFDMQIEDGEFDAANQTLERTAEHLPVGYAAAKRVCLFCKQRDRKQADEAFLTLCDEALETTTPIQIAMAGYQEQAWGPRALDIIEDKVFAQASVAAPVAAAWVQIADQLKKIGRCRSRLQELQDKPELWTEATAEYITLLGRPDRYYDLKGFAFWHKKQLREHDQTWWAVGSAYLDALQPAHVISWMKDWQERNAEPYMYFPLVVALWQKRRATLAANVCRHAVQRGNDHTVCLHNLWLVAEHLAKARIDEASQLIVQLHRSEMNEYYQEMYDLLHLACSLLGSDSNTSYSEAIASLKSNQKRRLTQTDQLQRRLYHFVCWRLAEKHKRPLAALWSRVLTWSLI